MSFNLFLKTLPTLALVTLVGCLSENDKENGGGGGKNGKINVTETYTLHAITPQSESAPGQFVIEGVDEWCDDGVLKSETYEWMQNFWVEDKTMLQWESYDCKAMRLTGAVSDSSPLGTWKSTALYGADIPEAFRLPFCEEEEDDELMFLRDVEITQVVTRNSVSNTISARICFAEMFGTLMFVGDGDTEGPVIQGADCESVTLVADGKTATLASQFKNDKLSMTFQHAASTCKADFPLSVAEIGSLNCAEEEEEEEGFQEFYTCLFQSGFFSDMLEDIEDDGLATLEKKAGDKELFKTLRKALRRPL